MSDTPSATSSNMELEQTVQLMSNRIQELQLQLQAVLKYNRKLKIRLSKYENTEDESSSDESSSPETSNWTTVSSNKKRKNASPRPTSPNAKVAIIEAGESSLINNSQSDEEMDTVVQSPLSVDQSPMDNSRSFPPLVAIPSSSRATLDSIFQPSRSSQSAPQSASQTTTQTKHERVPPLMLNNPADLSKVKSFCAASGVKIVKCRASGSRLSVTVATPGEYRRITNHLKEAKISFHHYCLQEDIPLKVVVRGWPVALEPEVAAQSLRDQGFHPIKVTRMNRLATKEPMPLLFVEVPQTETNIYEVKTIDCLMVKIEKPHKKSGIQQCHRCQQWNHSQSNCFAPARCVKCAGNHLTSDCERSKTSKRPPKCANCGGEHPANSRTCPKFPQISNIQNQTTFVNPNVSVRTFTSNPTRNGVAYAQVLQPPQPAPRRTTSHSMAPRPVAPQPLASIPVAPLQAAAEPSSSRQDQINLVLSQVNQSLQALNATLNILVTTQ